MRKDQLNKDYNREENEEQNVQNKKAENMRDSSNPVSPTELLQFHIGCFRCNFCHVLLKERAGK